MQDYESNILAHIEEHGCSVTSVFDPDGKDPTFSYSIGIAKSTMAPELIVVGLKQEMGHWLVNEYNRRVRAREVFAPGVLYLGFLEGFAVQLAPVAPEHRQGYMCSATWLHDGPDFEALQLIWPSTDEPPRLSWRLFGLSHTCSDPALSAQASLLFCSACAGRIAAQRIDVDQPGHHAHASFDCVAASRRRPARYS